MTTGRGWQGITVAKRGMSHEQKMAKGFVAVEVGGKLEYLTPMQEKFVRFWVLAPDQPSRAAWLAGYGETSVTDKKRWDCCYCQQYELRRKKKIAARYAELKKLADRGINITPEV